MNETDFIRFVICIKKWKPQEGIALCQEMCTQDCSGSLKGFLQNC